jgi:hypothetical protein
MHARDYITVGPFTYGEPPVGAMMTLNSDLGPNGVTLAVQNNPQHHDIAWFQSIGLSGWSDGTPHLIVQHSGMVNLGPKTNAAPALLPNGPELQTKLGDGSAFADTRAAIGSLETRLCLGKGTSPDRAGIAPDTSFGQVDITYCGGSATGYGKLNSQEYHLTTSGVLQWAPTVNPSSTSPDLRMTKAAAGRLLVDGGKGAGAGLQLAGGVQPTCDVNSRGTFWYMAGADGVKDSVAVCAKDESNVYAWRPIY